MIFKSIQLVVSLQKLAPKTAVKRINHLNLKKNFVETC